ncbi:hypothetical protein [Paeniglutamicibacter antarcticus]|uniref:Uncharacterized protein n=1 Tax=Paeniglutamicibacter antarcticus TaxID=494023 RepID=A0ABP9TQM3_9MICC
MNRNHGQRQDAGDSDGAPPAEAAALPPAVLRVQEDFFAMRHNFRNWLEVTDPQFDPNAAMNELAFLLANCAARDRAFDATNPSVDTVRGVLGMLEDQFPQSHAETRAGLGRFMEFLDESQLFSGSDDSYEQVYDLATDEDDDPEPQDLVQGWTEVRPAVLYSSSLGEDETLTAMEALPLTEKARSFLSWIGKSKEVTGRGVLRRKDIQAAAASLGEDAVGVATGSAPDFWEPEAAGRFEVRSMSEAPQLDLYWQMLRYSGLIELTSTRIRPTERGLAFLAGEPKTSATAVRSMATTAYKVLAGVISNSNGEVHWHSAEAGTLLLDGATVEPLETSYVLEGTYEGRFMFEPLAEVLSGALRRAVMRWIADGLLDAEEYVVVPEVLLPSLADALAETYRASIGGPRH